MINVPEYNSLTLMSSSDLVPKNGMYCEYAL
jgi:hypothetical protein